MRIIERHPFEKVGRGSKTHPIDNVHSFLFPVDIIDEVYIKRITFDGYSASALELAELHDGEKFETPNKFLTVFGFVDEGSHYQTNASLVSGYTMRITIATASITSIHFFGEENSAEARRIRLMGILQLNYTSNFFHFVTNRFILRGYYECPKKVAIKSQ